MCHYYRKLYTCTHISSVHLAQCRTSILTNTRPCGPLDDPPKDPTLHQKSFFPCFECIQRAAREEKMGAEMNGSNTGGGGGGGGGSGANGDAGGASIATAVGTDGQPINVWTRRSEERAARLEREQMEREKGDAHAQKDKEKVRIILQRETPVAQVDAVHNGAVAEHAQNVHGSEMNEVRLRASGDVRKDVCMGDEASSAKRKGRRGPRSASAGSAAAVRHALVMPVSAAAPVFAPVSVGKMGEFGKQEAARTDVDLGGRAGVWGRSSGKRNGYGGRRRGGAY